MSIGRLDGYVRELVGEGEYVHRPSWIQSSKIFGRVRKAAGSFTRRWKPGVGVMPERRIPA